jgi:cbb3-type cytochrome oxidase subunit 1
MQGVARNFFTMAVIYALVGMTLGLSMAMSHDHGQLPTHAHIMVLGWVMSAVFAFFYHLVPAARNSKLAIIHFWLAAVSSVGMFVGLYVLYGGNPSIEPVLGISAMAYFVATVLFAFIALRALWGGETAGATGRVATS